MTATFLSVRTRNAIRDVLKARTLQELRDLFSECGIERGLPSFSTERQGERHELIELYFSGLNLNLRSDALKLLAVAARIAEEWAHTAHLADAHRKLADSLLHDGFTIGPRKLQASSIEKQIIFSDLAPPATISTTTRQRIRDNLVREKIKVEGSQTFQAFIGRFTQLPSSDIVIGLVGTMLTALQPVSSLDLSASFACKPLDWPDEPFLRLLTESLHPDIRTEVEAESILPIYNKHLSADDWEIFKGNSGQTNYMARRRDGTVALPESIHASEILSQAHVREVADKCQLRLDSNDLRGAITVARTLVEEVMGAIERQAGQPSRVHKDLPTQFKVVSGLIGLDPASPALHPSLRSLIQGLTTAVQGLAEVRNDLGDAHSSSRAPTHHEAQLAVNASRTIAIFLVAQCQAQTLSSEETPS